LVTEEWQELDHCRCPACRAHGNAGLRADRLTGFVNRAIHNLSMLLEEAALIKWHLKEGDFAAWSARRVRGNRMADLVAYALECDA
jgi:7-cyano-7-deazaguanine tRNA-ribosyltransferase